MGFEWIFISIFQILVAMGIFAALAYIAKYIVTKGRLMARFKKSKLSNPQEYFPSEEVFLLKQVFYLMVILVIIMICLYLTFDWDEGFYFVYLLDIVISLYLALKMDKDSPKDKVLLFLLIPFGSITGILFGDSIVGLLDLTHIIGYLYFIKVYFRKFVEYTENNGLGITIILLFSIILISFLFTIVVENVSPMDSITMVSNAFTSNSFDASGKNIIGKINSLILAWSGFILSGVGTATLAVSIVNEYVNRQFAEIKDLVKKKKEEK
ncbi:hypothetical protein [uncultured Methanobrevibacter sp.]|uniref:hypothetical protein n=1 Tax=uncultured Methanobrevibacter sp. TaxID=253161 RepID=UPI0025E1101B|nr:hypothetical protein [uncultured Methanobrevibacter sp.]